MVRFVLHVRVSDEAGSHFHPLCHSVEALSEALCGWGEDDAAVVVISHDRAFCENIGFTHVATVADGKLKLEQRGMRDDDWQVVSTTLDAKSSLAEEESQATKTTEMDPVLRKKLFNAPKRIAKLESLIEKAEEKIASIEEEMLANGSDVGKLVDLTATKEKLEGEVMELMEEWEELEALLADSK